jgi:iron complex transport system substrate-binding protein
MEEIPLHKKKGFIVLFVFFYILLLMSGCGSNTAEKPDTDKAQTYTITDQMGRTVTLPVKINRIVCLQHHSLDILAELQAQDKVVGVMKDWDNLLDSSFAKIFPGIENMPQPGSLQSASIEEIAALQPDIVIVSNQMPMETIDKLQSMGIPVVAITLYISDKEQASTIHPELIDPDEAYTDGLQQAIQILGKIASKEEKADALWQYVIKNRQIVAEHLTSIPEEKRIHIYMANENMYTYGTGKYVGAAMARAGAKNVAETLHGYKQVTPEQVAAWNPDVIFVQSRYASILEQIKTSPAWSEINAVKNGRLYIAPDYTKPWGNPTPESIALGEVWLAKTLYPEAFQDVDMNALVEDFYHTFYGISYQN